MLESEALSAAEDAGEGLERGDGGSRDCSGQVSGATGRPISNGRIGGLSHPAHGAGRGPFHLMLRLTGAAEGSKPK